MDKEALLWNSFEGKRVHCHLCAHECRIAEAGYGICGVRQNVDGALCTKVYGQVIAAHVDPIEKKPLYHFLPGSTSYSIATVGCNFKCGFCQNWQISQASIRDGAASEHLVRPEQIVEQAKESRCTSISYTYTEPTIFFEYAYDTAQLAKKAGLANIFVTNGYMTREALDMIKPFLDAANVDLKSFRNDYYSRNCKGHLQPVLDTLSAMKELGIWLEVTTLVIPGENDSDEELGQIAAFLAGIDKDIPWHVSRFHPDYRFLDHTATPVATLRRAKEIGHSQGLRYIYLGNVPEGANTYCYHCQTLVIERKSRGMAINLKGRHCPACGTDITGIWS